MSYPESLASRAATDESLAGVDDAAEEDGSTAAATYESLAGVGDATEEGGSAAVASPAAPPRAAITAMADVSWLLLRACSTNSALQRHPWAFSARIARST